MATLPRLHRLWSATRVTGGEPGINFVLEIIDQTWSAAMVGWTPFDHAPLRQRRPADANIKGCFPSPQSRLLGDHSVHLGDRDSIDARVTAIPLRCLVIQRADFPNRSSKTWDGPCRCFLRSLDQADDSEAFRILNFSPPDSSLLSWRQYRRRRVCRVPGWPRIGMRFAKFCQPA